MHGYDCDQAVHGTSLDQNDTIEQEWRRVKIFPGNVIHMMSDLCSTYGPPEG